MIYNSIDIPVPDPLAMAPMRRTLKKMGFTFTEVTKRDKTVVFTVFYANYIDLYYLGCQVVLDTVGLFKSPLLK